MEDYRPRYKYEWCAEKQTEYHVAHRSDIEHLAGYLSEKYSGDYLYSYIITLIVANSLLKKISYAQENTAKIFP